MFKYPPNSYGEEPEAPGDGIGRWAFGDQVVRAQPSWDACPDKSGRARTQPGAAIREPASRSSPDTTATWASQLPEL